MKHPYDDILCVSYPFSTLRKRMPMKARAGQFSPFAALTGYDALIQESGRLTDKYVELDPDAQMVIDDKLRYILEFQDRKPEVTVTYFVPDGKKTGGSYVRIKGHIRKVDKNMLILNNGMTLFFHRILDIDTDCLQFDLL